MFNLDPIPTHCSMVVRGASRMQPWYLPGDTGRPFPGLLTSTRGNS